MLTNTVVPKTNRTKNSKRSTRIVAATVVALTLGACVTESGPKQTVGTLLGAAGGGLLGAQFGGGRGKLAAVAAGTLIGAFLGNELGRSLDRTDRMAMAGAQETAQSAPLNEPVYWRNPDSGNSGTVTAVREGTTQSGQHCREFQHTVFIGGKAEKGYGTACLQPDGSWRLLNG